MIAVAEMPHPRQDRLRCRSIENAPLAAVLTNDLGKMAGFWPVRLVCG
jgi:hypothetical protein